MIDASTIVGAVLKPDSIPEQALLLASAQARICLSDAVEDEIRRVLARDRFRRLGLRRERADALLRLLTADAVRCAPVVAVADCRDAKDNKYLELALACGAETIIASDADLLVLHPWRGIAVVTPAAYVARFAEARRPPGAF